MKTGQPAVWVLCGALLFGVGARAQAVYNGGRSGGRYTLLSGDHVRFTAGTAPAPDYLYVLVEQGEGNVIIIDGQGDQSSGLYLNTGDLLFFGIPSPFDLYFQGGIVQIAYGGAIIGAPLNPICRTGALGPVILLPDKKYGVAVQSASSTSVKVGTYGSVRELYSGNLAYILATGYTASVTKAVPACAGSSCCNPTESVFSVKNATGASFGVVRMLSTQAANVDYAMVPPPPLAASAGANPTSGPPPLTVQFTGSASGGSPPYRYLWNFKDGSAHKTARNPKHTYKSAGTYHPVLTVTDSVSAQNKDRSLVVTVGTVLTAAADGGPLSGDVPLAVAFTGDASGGTPPYTYSWDFGEGNPSAIQNPSHTYTTPGTFRVALAVQDAAGAVASDDHLTVRVVDPTALAASAQADPDSGAIPLTVQFAGAASGGTPPYTYSWTFGDGSGANGQNAAHTYGAVGDFHPVLSVGDAAGGSAADSHLVIRANPAESVPVITKMKRIPSPFRLKITGSGFLPGCQVLIEGSPVPEVSYKSANRVVAKKGKTLKAMAPKGAPVCVTVRNPGGTESACFAFTR